MHKNERKRDSAVREMAAKNKSGYAFTRKDIGRAMDIEYNGHDVSPLVRKSLSDDLLAFRQLPKRDQDNVIEGTVIIRFDCEGNRKDEIIEPVSEKK